jgi:hypothetical protein
MFERLFRSSDCIEKHCNAPLDKDGSVIWNTLPKAVIQPVL